MSLTENLILQIIRQNEIIISLLGRFSYDEEKVRKIVTYKKRSIFKQKYIEGFNACDGTKTVTELCEIIGVTVGTLSPILQEWEEKGIIYEIYKPGGKFYKKIFPL